MLRPDTDGKYRLWPWRDWMTIGIGVVCTLDKTADSLIFVSDRLGSFGDSFSTRLLGKMFVEISHQLFAVAADNVGNAGQLLPIIAEEWSKTPERTAQQLMRGVTQAVQEYKEIKFCQEAAPKFGIKPDENWRIMGAQMGLMPKLLKAWNKFSFHCDVIVGTFDGTGFAHMYVIYGDGEIHHLTAPGFFAIGTGADNACFWLGYRQQNFAMNLNRSAYHAFEAKLMAEQSPHVGRDDLDMLVVPRRHARAYHLSKEFPEPEGCPVSLRGLQDYFKHFGPRPTDAIAIIGKGPTDSPSEK